MTAAVVTFQLSLIFIPCRYDCKGIVVLDRCGRSAYEFEIAFQLHHATNRKRHHHGLEGIDEMGAISLQQRCEVESRDTMVRKDLLIPCKKAQFVRPPGFGSERCSQEVRDIANPFANADELPVEESWLGLLPEKIAGMQIVMDEGAWATRKKTHRVATLASIVHSGGVERRGHSASRPL